MRIIIKRVVSCLLLASASPLAAAPSERTVPISPPATRPAERAPDVFSLVFTLGWGVGMNKTIHVSSDGRFEYVERRMLKASKSGGRIFELRTWTGKLSDSELTVLVNQVAAAEPGPPAEDAGYVECKWVGTDGVRRSKSFTMPSAHDCKALVAEVTRQALQEGTAGEPVTVEDLK